MNSTAELQHESISFSRSERIHVRLTPSQKDAVDALARREGLTRSDFVLQALSKYILQVCELERQKLQDGPDDLGHEPPYETDEGTIREPRDGQECPPYREVLE